MLFDSPLSKEKILLTYIPVPVDVEGVVGDVVRLDHPEQLAPGLALGDVVDLRVEERGAQRDGRRNLGTRVLIVMSLEACNFLLSLFPGL